MGNVKRRTQRDAETILIVLRFLLWPAQRVGATVQCIRSCIENGVVGAVENGTVGLVDIKPAHSPTKRKNSWSTPKTTASTLPFPTENDWASATPETAFALHTIAELLNAVLNLVRIHAEVLCLAHRSRYRHRLSRSIRTSAVQRKATRILTGVVVISSRSGNCARLRLGNRQALHASVGQCSCNLLSTGRLLGRED